jgi:hypothetical protein
MNISSLRPIGGLLLAGALALSGAGCAATSGAGSPAAAGGSGDAPASAPVDSPAQPRTDGEDGADAGLGTDEGAAAGGSGTDEGAAAGASGTKGASGTGSAGGGDEGVQTRPMPKDRDGKIIYFRVAQWPECPYGTVNDWHPGRPLILEWKIEHAYFVHLVDERGVERVYGTEEGTETIEFDCSMPRTTEVHRYTLRTDGDGRSQSKTLTVRAEVSKITLQ